MIRAEPTAFAPPPTTFRPPPWARLDLGELSRNSSGFDAAFAAGAALAALDATLRAKPVALGALRARLALRAAAESAKFLGRREDEGSLRDAFVFASTTDPGPAGRVLIAWRALASASDPLAERTFFDAAQNLGVAAADLAGLAPALSALAADRSRAPLTAASDAACVVVERLGGQGGHERIHELLALWVADAVLGVRLGWTVKALGDTGGALPLLSSEAFGAAARIVPNGAIERRRARPSDEAWPVAVAYSYARAATAACALAMDLETRATRLLTAAPVLRAKGARAAIARLLADDVVAASEPIEGLSERGLRRLLDRLVALGACRELSGRPTFRLYGL